MQRCVVSIMSCSLPTTAQSGLKASRASIPLTNLMCKNRFYSLSWRIVFVYQGEVLCRRLMALCGRCTTPARNSCFIICNPRSVCSSWTSECRRTCDSWLLIMNRPLFTKLLCLVRECVLFLLTTNWCGLGFLLSVYFHFAELGGGLLLFVFMWISVLR